MIDIGRNLQRAYDEGYKQGRYDEKVEAEKSLPSGEQTHALRTQTHAMRSDTISRQDAIDAAVEAADEWDGGYSRSREEIITLKLRMLPSAQPECKSGEWIDYTEDGYVECPFCHSATNCDGNKDELHFCFSCGADMRGENYDKG